MIIRIKRKARLINAQFNYMIPAVLTEYNIGDLDYS